MNYPQWWERLVAAVIDGIIVGVAVWAVQRILLSIWLSGVMLFIAVVIGVAIAVAYKVFFEGGTWQATPGKMAFGIKVGTSSGGRGSTNAVLMRTWPWWIQIVVIIPALLGSLNFAATLNIIVVVVMVLIAATFFMDPKGRCIHDQTADLYVNKAGKGAVG